MALEIFLNELYQLAILPDPTSDGWVVFKTVLVSWGGFLDVSANVSLKIYFLFHSPKLVLIPKNCFKAIQACVAR